MLATVEDVQALGGVAVGAVIGDTQRTRCLRLLQLASSQVITYLGLESESEVAGWSSAKLDVLAVVTAEVAASRLNVTAAPNSDPYGEPVVAIMTAMLAPRHKRTLNDLIGRVGRGSVSIVTTRDPLTSYLGYIDTYDPWDTQP